MACNSVCHRAPFVAVCGLTGGIGTSTLALLTAHALSAEASGPALLCELDGAGGGLAELAGASSPRSLSQLAAGIRGRGLPFVALDARLRLIATPPHSPIDVSDQALVDTLTSARSVHAITVLDCGTVTTPGVEVALSLASHIVWVVGAGPRAAARVQAVLLDGALSLASAGTPALLAVAAIPATDVRVDAALRDVAADCCQRLVLIPNASAQHARRRRGTGLLDGAVAAVVEFLHASSRAYNQHAELPFNHSRNPVVNHRPTPAQHHYPEPAQHHYREPTSHHYQEEPRHASERLPSGFRVDLG
jgi:hypothetical protein